MLFILIPVAWLTVASFFVVLCQMAARADAPEQAATESAPTRARAGLLVWDVPSPSAAYTGADGPGARRHLREAHARRAVTPRRRTVAHGAR
jgi:hypothetical protein